MTRNQSSYRQIFKTNSIFAGVQVFNILISLIRGKVLASLLGTAGMGLNGLLMSGLNLIKIASGLGLEQSAIRDISGAHGSGDEQMVNRIYTIFRRWVWVTAALGVILTCGLSSVLSRMSFGDNSHTISYLLLSATFIFGALMGGIYTLMRGTRKIEILARANVAGAVAGLLAILPVFYFMGIKGVVPAIIISSLVGYLVSLYFRKKINVKTIEISWNETFSEGKGMVILGITLSFSALFTTGTEYFLNTFISRTGSLSELGLFNAGMAIMSGYVGMIFTAVGTDFYPRLSSVINNEKEWKELVNQQSELLLLIMGPLLCLMLATAPIVIRVLLSSEFSATMDFLIWAVLAVFLKGLTWVQGFIIIAKGQSRLYLLTEIIGSVFSLLLSMLLFSYLGIKGLGISMLITFIFSIILLAVVLKRKFDFAFSRTVTLFTAIFFLLLTFCLAGIFLLDYPYAYFSGIFFFLVAAGLAYHELNKRMDFSAILLNIRNKFF
jgi:O-antigen/teichoic acid export membrane protein